MGERVAMTFLTLFGTEGRMEGDQRSDSFKLTDTKAGSSPSRKTPAVPNPLQVLIKHQLDQHGWSYSDVARRGGVSRSTVHHLATSERLARMPQQSTLEGLAKGLDIPVTPVHRAAAEACGVHLYLEDTPEAGDPEVAILIASVQKLGPVDRRHVSALVESLLRTSAADEEKSGRR